jgi:membrane fusion protein, copper/silver efflux system
MKTLSLALCALAFATASLFAADSKPALTPAQKAFLAKYEPVRAALASDNLAKAKSAAADLATVTEGKDVAAAAKKLAAADSIKDARDAFKAVSKRAVELAAGQPGYYHAHCPMVPGNQGDWVQTNEKINNPYFGKSMLTCGSIEK